MNMHEAIEAAVKNIASHGDTDIFPFPFECHLFRDEPKRCVDLLEKMHANFEELGTIPQWSEYAFEANHLCHVYDAFDAVLESETETVITERPDFNNVFEHTTTPKVQSY